MILETKKVSGLVLDCGPTPAGRRTHSTLDDRPGANSPHANSAAVGNHERLRQALGRMRSNAQASTNVRVLFGREDVLDFVGRGMSAVWVAIDPSRSGRLERLWQSDPTGVTSPDPPTPRPIDWDRLDEEIQATLTKLWEAIEPRIPTARSRCGRTRSATFPLFSYRIFCLVDQQDENPVVAGVEIKLQGSEYYRISAEIGREESGLVMLSEVVECAGVPELLEQAVRTMLDRIVDSRGLIEEALLGSE